MLGVNNICSSSEPFSCLMENNINSNIIGSSNNNNKRKRRPAGTPDPDAEVVSLSPKTLLESDRYVCEICNQGFQRDQNLQMHRRRHKVPWKLLKRETPAGVVRKRVFVCPEPTCLHHDPCHALGDLVGIKKHFRRKHSNHKQWVCQRCSKAYAVHSDFKAHLKTCGTRGHSCDCGRVFSRVESFIEHQDACTMGRLRSESHTLQPAACLSRTASSPSPSSTDTNLAVPINTTTTSSINNINPSETTTTTTTAPALVILTSSSTRSPTQNPILSKTTSTPNQRFHNLDLQLSTTTVSNPENHPILLSPNNKTDPNSTHDREINHQYSTQLQLSIGSSDFGGEKNHNSNNNNVESNANNNNNHKSSPRESMMSSTTTTNTTVEKTRLMKEEAREQLRVAMAEKCYAEEARQQAKRQIELAEKEFANAKRIRQQAQSELDKAQALKEHAMKQLNSTLLQLTCHACKHHFHNNSNTNNNSNARTTLSYIIASTTSSDCAQTLDNNDRNTTHLFARSDNHRLGKSATINNPS
ncbi:zinc finger protein SHOOT GRAVITROPISM 5-like [Cannabis sativa]|uniref:zinc finger protein SHOOT GRAVITROPISM 5-like n=1 Tax=Cannabis sativa TaxID=3483 RepID=UPI0029C9B49A|nr:zinc finger protein SHOOT GRAVITROPISM 5-like [Cannabis sativa]